MMMNSKSGGLDEDGLGPTVLEERAQELDLTRSKSLKIEVKKIKLIKVL